MPLHHDNVAHDEQIPDDRDPSTMRA